jgi:hypothetical protein
MSRYLYIVILIFAGEMVFGLPFNTARFFRPTMLEVFGFTNTQLGDLFAIYGITAMLSYFPGGGDVAHRNGARRRLHGDDPGFVGDGDTLRFLGNNDDLPVLGSADSGNKRMGWQV